MANVRTTQRTFEGQAMSQYQGGSAFFLTGMGQEYRSSVQTLWVQFPTPLLRSSMSLRQAVNLLGPPFLYL